MWILFFSSNILFVSFILSPFSIIMWLWQMKSIWLHSVIQIDQLGMWKRLFIFFKSVRVSNEMFSIMLCWRNRNKSHHIDCLQIRTIDVLPRFHELKHIPSYIISIRWRKYCIFSPLCLFINYVSFLIILISCFLFHYYYFMMSSYILLYTNVFISLQSLLFSW